MTKKENLFSAVVSIVLGCMLIVMKGDIIRIALTVLGIAVLLSAVNSLICGMTNNGIIKAVIGICILVFGWMFINLALYILAAGIIVSGLLQISDIHKFAPVNLTGVQKCLAYAGPVFMVAAGACLLFNQGGTIAWIFIITGLLLVAEGVMQLIGTIRYQ